MPGNGASRDLSAGRSRALVAQDHRRTRLDPRRLRAVGRRAQRLLHRQVQPLRRSAHLAPHRAALYGRSSPNINPDIIGGTELGGVVIATAVSQLAGIPDDRGAQEAQSATAPSPTSTSKGLTAPASTCSCSRTSSPTGATCSPRPHACASSGLQVTPYAVVSRGLAPVRALIQFSLPHDKPKTEN